LIDSQVPPGALAGESSLDSESAHPPSPTGNRKAENSRYSRVRGFRRKPRVALPILQAILRQTDNSLLSPALRKRSAQHPAMWIRSSNRCTNSIEPCFSGAVRHFWVPTRPRVIGDSTDDPWQEPTRCIARIRGSARDFECLLQFRHAGGSCGPCVKRQYGGEKPEAIRSMQTFSRHPTQGAYVWIRTSAEPVFRRWLAADPDWRSRTALPERFSRTRTLFAGFAAGSAEIIVFPLERIDGRQTDIRPQRLTAPRGAFWRRNFAIRICTPRMPPEVAPATWFVTE